MQYITIEGPHARASNVHIRTNTPICTIRIRCVRLHVAYRRHHMQGGLAMHRAACVHMRTWCMPRRYRAYAYRMRAVRVRACVRMRISLGFIYFDRGRRAGRRRARDAHGRMHAPPRPRFPLFLFSITDMFYETWSLSLQF